MSRFLRPQSKHPRDYDPTRKLQKIPTGENFVIVAEDSRTLDVALTNTTLANVALTGHIKHKETDNTYQVNALAPGLTTLTLKDPASGTMVDFLDIEIVAGPPRSEDLVYDGSRLTWFRDGQPPASFRATSGLGWPTAANQAEANRGPIPEGRYSFLAQRDPVNGGVATLNSSNDLDSREGIQFLPHDKKLTALWGTHRVRLTPIFMTVRGRGGFYLHDSHKGYTHGCVETEDRFFEMLLQYADSGPQKTRLTMKVTYAAPAVSTEGGTSDTMSETFHNKTVEEFTNQ